MVGGVPPIGRFKLFSAAVICESFLFQPNVLFLSSWLKVFSPLICIVSLTSPGRIFGKFSKPVCTYFVRSNLMRGDVFIGAGNMVRDVGELGWGWIYVLFSRILCK